MQTATVALIRRGLINKDKEHLAERLIGRAFLLLAAYLLVQSAVVLVSRFHPSTSLLGIVWIALTVIAMLLLAWGKGRTGRELGNPVLVKESKVTVVDGMLAAAVLSVIFLLLLVADILLLYRAALRVERQMDRSV